jgi:DNA polymerase IV (archaeal DinB-like DNA polymerase)
VREHPELKGKPVVGGADPKRGMEQGVVITCSYEARKYEYIQSRLLQGLLIVS